MYNATDPATIDQLFAIEHLLGRAVQKAGLTFGSAQMILGSKGSSQKAVSATLSALGIELALNPYAEERDWCMDFLSKRQVLTTGLDEAVIPERPSDTAWLIPMPAGYGCNQIFDTLWTFAKWRWNNDIDGNLVDQDLSARFIWIEPNLPDLEPDARTLGQSANRADPDQQSVQLREGMMFYVIAHTKTGRVPDKKGVTICGGSRDRDGGVPYLYLDYDGGASVSRCHPDLAFGAFGVRQAVR